MDVGSCEVFRNALPAYNATALHRGSGKNL